MNWFCQQWITESGTVLVQLWKVFRELRLLEEEEESRKVGWRVGGAQCDQIWRSFANLEKKLKAFGKFWRFYFLICKMFSVLCQIVTLLSKFFIIGNGQMLKNNLNIWSHWWRQSEDWKHEFWPEEKIRFAWMNSLVKNAACHSPFHLALLTYFYNWG